MLLFIKKIKSTIYYNLNLLFPLYFKKKSIQKINSALDSSSNFELLPEKELLLLHFLLQENSVAIDIGANNGIYCCFFKDIEMCDRVLAFEPLPNLFKKLKIWYKNVDLINLALSNKKGTTTIRIPFINRRLYESRAKLDDFKEENETHAKELVIHTDTLDNVLKEYSLTKLDIIKIDIEGHELPVIEGARQTIKHHSPFLLIELEYRHHQSQFNQAISTICDLDYKAFFFHSKEKKILPFSSYNVVEMQNTIHQNTFDYINNFLFVPNQKLEVIEMINKKLDNYFKFSIDEA